MEKDYLINTDKEIVKKFFEETFGENNGNKRKVVEVTEETYPNVGKTFKVLSTGVNGCGRYFFRVGQFGLLYHSAQGGFIYETSITNFDKLWHVAVCETFKDDEELKSRYTGAYIGNRRDGIIAWQNKEIERIKNKAENYLNDTLEKEGKQMLMSVGSEESQK